VFTSKVTKYYYEICTSLIAVSTLYSGSPSFVLDSVEEKKFYLLDVSEA